MLYWRRLLRDPSFRNQEGVVVIEGKNLVLDLFRRGVELHMVVTTKEIEELASIADRVTPKQYALFSQLNSPEGVAALVSIPPEVPIEESERLLILDGLQDPGNVGTLLRTACALGFTHVGAIMPCCDFWNEKVVRSAKGAHFSLKLSRVTLDELIEWQRKKGAKLYGADTVGQDVARLVPPAAFACILGNEGGGLREELKAYVEQITIPMAKGLDSLNVAQAGAIILYLLGQH